MQEAEGEEGQVNAVGLLQPRPVFVQMMSHVLQLAHAAAAAGVAFSDIVVPLTHDGVVFILEQLLLLPPLADTQAQYAAPGDWYLQTLFDAHVLVTIARQHHKAGASTGSDPAAAVAAPGIDLNEGVSSVDSALAALTHRLKQRLDVVVYRFFSPHIVGAAAAAAARCTTLASACCSPGWGVSTASPPIKTPLDCILSSSAASLRFPLLPTAIDDSRQQQQHKHAKPSSSIVSGAAAAVGGLGGLLKPWLRGSK